MKFIPATVRLEEHQIKLAIEEFVKSRGYSSVGKVTIGSLEGEYRGPTVYHAVVEVNPSPTERLPGVQ